MLHLYVVICIKESSMLALLTDCNSLELYICILKNLKHKFWVLIPLYIDIEGKTVFKFLTEISILLYAIELIWRYTIAVSLGQNPISIYLAISKQLEIFVRIIWYIDIQWNMSKYWEWITKKP